MVRVGEVTDSELVSEFEEHNRVHARHDPHPSRRIAIGWFP